MSTTANTRLFDGTILQVRNAGNTAWIGTSELRSINGFGLTSAEIATATGFSDFADESRPGLPEPSDGTIAMYLDPDDPFQDEMETMRSAQSTRQFQIVLVEGTKTVAEFEGYVIDNSINGTFNGVYDYTLILASNSRILFAVPA